MERTLCKTKLKCMGLLLFRFVLDIGGIFLQHQGSLLHLLIFYNRKIEFRRGSGSGRVGERTEINVARWSVLRCQERSSTDTKGVDRGLILSRYRMLSSHGCYVRIVETAITS